MGQGVLLGDIDCLIHLKNNPFSISGHIGEKQSIIYIAKKSKGKPLYLTIRYGTGVHVLERGHI